MSKEKNKGEAMFLLLCRKVASLMTGGYRPEKHYMRGPGPKWREKHPK